MQKCRTARGIVYNERRNKWLIEVKRSLERDKGDGCLCPHRVIGGKLGDDGGQVSVVHARDDVRIGGNRNSGRDEQTRCRDKQCSHSRCSAGSRASPLLQAGVDRFDHLHVAFAHDAGLASIWSSAVARPLTEKLRVRGPLVCALAECEGVRGFINSIARLISGTHAISFPCRSSLPPGAQLQDKALSWSAASIPRGDARARCSSRRRKGLSPCRRHCGHLHGSFTVKQAKVPASVPARFASCRPASVLSCERDYRLRRRADPTCSASHS